MGKLKVRYEREEREVNKEVKQKVKKEMPIDVCFEESEDELVSLRR